MFRKKFLAISMDHDAAERPGIVVRLWDFLFYASFGFVVTALGRDRRRAAGVLLSDRAVGRARCCLPTRIGQRLAIGWTMGTVVSALGVYLSLMLDLPTGATIVCTFGLVLILMAIVRVLMPAVSAPSVVPDRRTLPSESVRSSGGLRRTADPRQIPIGAAYIRRMQCRNCGTEIADKAIVCYRCGAATTDPVRKPVPVPAAARPGRPLCGRPFCRCCWRSSCSCGCADVGLRARPYTAAAVARRGRAL